MGFVTDLSPYGGFSGIHTCVVKLTKFIKLIPILLGDGALSAPEVACFFFEHVVHLFDIPCMVLYDRNTCFTAHFWRCLWELLGSQAALSLAYHPQSDGQTEYTHQTVK